MNLLDTIFEALLDGHVLSLQEDSYSALKNEEVVTFYNHLLVHASEQPDEHPNQAMVRENLAFHILAEGENAILIRSFLAEHMDWDESQAPAELLKKEEPELAALVETPKKLASLGALVAARLLASGEKLGRFDKESREDLSFEEDTYVYERGDSFSTRADLRLEFQTEAEICAFLTKAGWIQSKKGMVFFRGNLAWLIRGWLEDNEGVQTLREFARKGRSG